MIPYIHSVTVVPCTVLGTGETAENKENRNPCLGELAFEVGEGHNKIYK